MNSAAENAPGQPVRPALTRSVINTRADLSISLIIATQSAVFWINVCSQNPLLCTTVAITYFWVEIIPPKINTKNNVKIYHDVYL